MFNTCAHGFIAVTCPTCKHAPTPSAFEGDDEGSVYVNMAAIIDRATSRVERTGRRDMAMVRHELEERFT